MQGSFPLRAREPEEESIVPSTNAKAFAGSCGFACCWGYFFSSGIWVQRCYFTTRFEWVLRMHFKFSLFFKVWIIAVEVALNWQYLQVGNNSNREMCTRGKWCCISRGAKSAMDLSFSSFRYKSPRGNTTSNFLCTFDRDGNLVYQINSQMSEAIKIHGIPLCACYVCYRTRGEQSQKVPGRPFLMWLDGISYVSEHGCIDCSLWERAGWGLPRYTSKSWRAAARFFKGLFWNPCWR